MRAHVHRFIALGLFTLLATAAGCSSSGGGSGKCPFMHPDAAKIEAAKKVDADFIAAFNKQDADGVTACYADSPDTLFFPPSDMECRGRQQIHDCVAEIFQHQPGAKIEFVEPKYMVTGGNVISSGHWTLTPKSGEPMNGRFTEVIGKKNGKWVILADHASVPMGEGK